MSDSSDEEDLSRFREAVDTSFTKFIGEAKNISSNVKQKDNPKPKSERYLTEASHYNDVKVPEIMQKQIGDKVSAIINKNIEFVDIDDTKRRKHKIKGGVKLFKESSEFLSCEPVKDNYTELHNKESKKIKMKRRRMDPDDDKLSENDKVTAVAITGDSILSKEETRCWKSRRKEKIFKYKGKGKLLTSVD